MRILFVCLGNICRSPTADGIMRQIVKEKGLDWTIDSAGTGDWHIGKAPDKRAITTAKAYGVDLSPLRARQFSRKDFETYDRIFALDLQNEKDILNLASSAEERSKVQLFLEAAYEGRREGVTDPWYEEELFEDVFLEIREACERLVERLKQEV